MPIADHAGGFVNGIVRTFLHSNLSIILLVLSLLVGAAALIVTPREEDPQIVVPMADVFVSYPGKGAEEVEQLVTVPLERILYQIDGVEYVYSMSSADRAVITVRFRVGEDRERSLVKLFKRIEESKDLAPVGMFEAGGGWIMKPVEIDDVPIVTLTLRSTQSDAFTLRRVGEELAQRIAAVDELSRVSVVGGQPRVVHVRLDVERLAGFGLDIRTVTNALRAGNAASTAGTFQRRNEEFSIETNGSLASATEVGDLVIGVFGEAPVSLRQVAEISDGPDEATSFVRHTWGPARVHATRDGATGTILGREAGEAGHGATNDHVSASAVTIAIAKKKGTNAVGVASTVLAEAKRLRGEVVPDDIDVVVTRNSGLNANGKVNELIEGLWVAILIVVALLTLGLGWRESLVVALAIPVVFGLTLLVNLLAGYTINRVTLFALILSLGLLVDDPIVDVENIARHFSLRKRATRAIVLEAVSEIRPPLISATLAVIASFLPLFFITGMMGPYMRPMALNVPVTMVMSMLVAFTITPWLAYHLLKRKYTAGSAGHDHGDDAESVRRSPAYRIFQRLLGPLIRSDRKAFAFLATVAVLTAGAAGLAAIRWVPLKMLPFDNKTELLVLVDADEGTPLEQTDAVVREVEERLASLPEVTDVTSYVGVPSPVDFNGLVRHYYLNERPSHGEIRVSLVDKHGRSMSSHDLALRVRDQLTALAAASGARLKIVELPPGPPIIATLVAEVYGRDDHAYRDLIAAGDVVRRRLEREPGVVEVDDSIEADSMRHVFVPDAEKAALNGVTVADIAAALRTALGGSDVGTLAVERERQPLRINVRLPIEERVGSADLGRIQLLGRSGLVSLAELGRWESRIADKTIYHKNLHRVVYLFADTAGRPPADAVVDIMSDRADSPAPVNANVSFAGWVSGAEPRPLASRTHLTAGGGVPWSVADGFRIEWAGEGEWKITLDVFRDLGLAFGAALVLIYIILVAQTGSFFIPLVVMLAIPLTMVGIMPGFWLLGGLLGAEVGGYASPVFFTATAMIGMIALSGIVTRQSIILVDFIHLSLARGRTLADAVIESCAVRLRPILLVVLAAALASIPITVDPIFSGLAWALIFGLAASTAFTVLVIPLVYWLVYRNVEGHGAHVVDQGASRGERSQ
ncbi:MAG: efflux RND transporter permease subunit [Phycisphaerae bacterium]|nr:efflux RND transporter permease subunit [Phycisphaerae bacterium]